MSIYEKLFDWQKRLVDKFDYKQSFGLFLKMGLGKTPLSLGFAERNKCTKVIVITINAKALETEDVAGSWLDWASKSELDYHLMRKADNVFDFSNDRNECFVVNYEALFSRSKNKKAKVELKSYLDDFIVSCRGHNVAIIVDESHKIKNLQSMQTMSITKLKQGLKFVANKVYTYLLTGTPFTTGYIDLYSQLKLLGYDETKGQFIDQYCERGNIPGLLGWQQPIIAYKNIDQLFKMLHKYAITIDSEDVVDLPEQIVIDHTTAISQSFKLFSNEKIKGADILSYIKSTKLDLPEYVYEDWCIEDSKSYREHKQRNPFYRNIDFPSDNFLALTTGTMWLRARQLSIGFVGNTSTCCWYDRRRLDQLEDFLKNNEDNYLIFYNFTPELLELYSICESLGYNIDVYCGEMKSLTFYEKYAHQNEAQRLTNKKNVILANFASGSTGMNWQLYNSCIIFSLPLFKDYEQGIARIHRLGQTKTTFCHIFSQNNWLDNSMLKALKEKTQYSSDMFMSDLTRVQSIMEDEA